MSSDERENIHHNPRSWIAWKDEADRLRAEVARLTAERDEAREEATISYRALEVQREEVRRLREALRWFVVKWDDGLPRESFAPNIEDARAVLAERKP